MPYTRRWYEDNKEALAEKRKKRYAESAALRHAARERAKRYREQKKLERSRQPMMVEISGEEVRCFPIEKAAQKIGIDPKRIAYFQKRGYIPEALKTRPSRAYTQHQIDMIKKLEQFLAKNGMDLRRPDSIEGAAAKAALGQMTTAIHENWNH